MCINLERAGGGVDEGEWLYLVTGGAALGSGRDAPNPAPDWLPDGSWNQLQLLASLPAFKVN